MDIFSDYHEWWGNDEFHREDGPARVTPGGTREWYQYGARHREDGPAVERSNGTREWWLNGIELTDDEWQARMTKWRRNGMTIY